MGRFYIHIKERDQLILDEEGTELPGVAAATHEALLAARGLLADAIRAGDSTVPDCIVIADEAGRTVEEFPLAVVLPRSLRPPIDG
jgi:hypothetical protein